MTADSDEVFRLNKDSGHVVVKQQGIYLIYVQVTHGLHLISAHVNNTLFVLQLIV